MTPNSASQPNFSVAFCDEGIEWEYCNISTTKFPIYSPQAEFYLIGARSPLAVRLRQNIIPNLWATVYIRVPKNRPVYKTIIPKEKIVFVLCAKLLMMTAMLLSNVQSVTRRIRCTLHLVGFWFCLSCLLNVVSAMPGAFSHPEPLRSSYLNAHCGIL